MSRPNAPAASTPTLVAAAGPANFCDSCGREIGAWDGGLCGPCADDAWDRWLDRHDDVGRDG